MKNAEAAQDACHVRELNFRSSGATTTAVRFMLSLNLELGTGN